MISPPLGLGRSATNSIRFRFGATNSIRFGSATTSIWSKCHHRKSFHHQISPPLWFRQKRETTKIVGAATRHLIQMHFFFLMGVIKINRIIKVCVCYFFASLFCKSIGEHFWNKEKCFLFHFKSSWHYWDNQVLTFWIFKLMTSSNAQACNSKHISLNNVESFFPFLIWYKLAKFH